MARKTFVKKNLLPKKDENVIVSVTTTGKVTTDTSVDKSKDAEKTFVNSQLYIRLNNYLVVHNINTENFIDAAFAEVKRNPDLVKCLNDNPETLYNAMLFAAEIGLFISDTIGDLYLLTDKILKEGKEQIIIKPHIGYKGFITLLYRGGIVKNLWAYCVYDSDKFEYQLGLEPKVNHIPNSSGFSSSSNITHAYSVCKLANGETQFVVLDRQQIMAITNLNKSNNKMYFNDKKDPNHWMIKKLAIKQLAKLIPKDYYTKKALEFDNAFEGGAYLEMDNQTNRLKLVDTESAPKKKSGIYDFWD